MATTLGANALAELSVDGVSSRVILPRYDRSALPPSVAHIGVGGFHRAHQAVYLDELCADGLSGWGIRGVGLIAADRAIRDALAQQDHLYTVVERGSGDDRARVVGSIIDFVLAADDRGAVVERLASSATRIVSLTITEGGYCTDASGVALDEQHPDVRHDLELEASAQPRGVYGVLSRALAARRAAGRAPFTIMSCDNVQGNGDVLRDMLLAFCELRDPTLRAWVESNAAFPNSMVDRITPATTEADRALVRSAFAIEDAWPVVTEPFRQWVVEDQFVDGRPPWQDVGALLTADVLPYELMKLRLLNASHAAMAYLAALAGYEYVHEVMRDELFVRYLRRLMDEEVTPLLPAVPGVDLEAYKDSLIERFSNTSIRDQVARLCVNGSDRQPKFVLPSIHEAVARGSGYDCLLLASASWCRYLQGVDDTGGAIGVDDALRDSLVPLAVRAQQDPREFLGIRQVFGDLVDVPGLAGRYSELLAMLAARGARGVLEEFRSARGHAPTAG